MRAHGHSFCNTWMEIRAGSTGLLETLRRADVAAIESPPPYCTADFKLQANLWHCANSCHQIPHTGLNDFFFFFFLSPHISCWGHFPARVSIWVLPLSPRNPPLHLHLMSPMFRRAIRDKTTGRAADSKSGRDESERERPCDVQGNSRTRSKVPALGVWIESLE